MSTSSPLRRQICIIVPNLVKIEPFRRYGRFSIFQDGGRRHLGFWKFHIFNGWDAQKGRMRLHADFCRNRSNRIWDMAILPFFKMAAVRHLRFSKVKNFNFLSASEAHCASCAKFREDMLNRSGNMADFRLAAAAILDFGNFKILTVWTLKRVVLRLHATFCRNRSNRGCDMAIFQFFKMEAPPSWIFKSWKFQLAVPFAGPICVIVPNFAKIGQYVPKI